MLDLPKPRPAAGQLLVRVSACGVCRTDLHVVEGELAARTSPIVPGHQVVGVVAENPGTDDAVAHRAGRLIAAAGHHRRTGLKSPLFRGRCADLARDVLGFHALRQKLRVDRQ